MELTLGERAALLLIVKSGRALILASQLNTPGSDGRILVPEGKMNRELPRRLRRAADLRLQRVPATEAVAVEPVTVEGLQARHLIDVWPVGAVVVHDRDERRRLAVKQVVATLTPLAAKLLDVKLVERGPDESPRWADKWAVEAKPVVRREGSPYPEPYPGLVAPPDESKGKRAKRKAG